MQAPGRVLDVDAAELLERDEQLSALAAALTDVTDRRVGQLVLLHGEAGIGKTALLRAFCARTGKRSRVLWATCDPLFTPRPLGPLLDIARVTDGELREHVEPGGRPHDVARALMGELDRRSASVVVVEDLHWADEATLDVLRLCARRIDSVPALLVATYRDDGLHRSHPLRIMLGELPSGLSRRQELARLSRVARRLRELGERGVPRGPRPRTRANPAGLTAREVEVLGLLAEGLRNGEIAERLVVADKTIDHHVSAILRKLGARSRVEAIAKAAEQSLVTR